MGKKRNHEKKRILQRTLGELIMDFAQIDGESSRCLEKMIRFKTESELNANLKDPESPLTAFLLLHKSELQASASGRSYLQLLGMCQPLIVPDPDSGNVTTTSPSVDTTNLASDFESLLHKVEAPEHADIMQLAQSVFQDADIQSTCRDFETGSDNSLLGMADLMSRLTAQISSKLQATGGPNERLLEQAASLYMSKEFQDSLSHIPQFKELQQFLPAAGGGRREEDKPDDFLASVFKAMSSNPNAAAPGSLQMRGLPSRL